MSNKNYHLHNNKKENKENVERYVDMRGIMSSFYPEDTNGWRSYMTMNAIEANRLSHLFI